LARAIAAWKPQRWRVTLCPILYLFCTNETVLLINNAEPSESLSLRRSATIRTTIELVY